MVTSVTALVAGDGCMFRDGSVDHLEQFGSASYNDSATPDAVESQRCTRSSPELVVELSDGRRCRAQLLCGARCTRPTFARGRAPADQTIVYTTAVVSAGFILSGSSNDAAVDQLDRWFYRALLGFPVAITVRSCGITCTTLTT
jgi:hypothetical protein